MPARDREKLWGKRLLEILHCIFVVYADLLNDDDVEESEPPATLEQILRGPRKNAVLCATKRVKKVMHMR